MTRADQWWLDRMESVPSPRCGRLDDHEPHDWTGCLNSIQRCPGHVVIEGSNARG